MKGKWARNGKDIKKFKWNGKCVWDIPSENQIQIIKFYRYLVAEKKSPSRIIKYLYALRAINDFLKKPFEDATKDDIVEVVAQIEEKMSDNWSKRDYKECMKFFYRWLRGMEKEDGYPPEVEWLKPKRLNGNHKLPEELLTEEDIKKLVESADNIRDKAFVFTLYESGCRIGEILSLRIKNISFDEYGTVLLVDGKTGQRRIRVISATHFLSEWLNKHPLKNDPDALLWVSRDYRRNELTYIRVRNILRYLKEKAKVSKKVNPHNFRHSRATYLANHLTEAQMKEFFGWTQSSEMASVYVHLSGRDVDSALLKTYGIENKTKSEESLLKPKKCIRCNELNPPTNNFCFKCGIPLDKETIVKIIENDMERKDADEILDKIISNKTSREKLFTLIKNVLQNSK
ncbi:MAG TPA: tyrosine-type recombinase/integrase [archaeon]|nr:tyrosine-type recombinase/integrase [archaeon]